MVPGWGFGGGALLVIISLCVLFQISSMIIPLSRIPDLHGGLGGCLGFLTGDLKDGVIFDILDHLG